MTVTFTEAAHLAVVVVEGLGIAILVGGIVTMLALSVARLVRGAGLEPVYRDARQGLGRILLLGLEVLIAGDIVRTVAVDLSLVNVAELAAIVLIRTFLSWSIELETEGRWPWKQGAAPSETR